MGKMKVGMSVVLQINGHTYHGIVSEVRNETSYTLNIPGMSKKDEKDLLGIKEMGRGRY